MYYAQITNGVVSAVTETSGELDGVDMIPLLTFDVTLLGKSHKGNGVFEDKVQSRKEVVIARLTEIDEITDKPRTRRELALSKNATKAWLQTLDDEAAALRTELAGL